MSIRIQKSKCAGCGRCIEACPGNLIKKDKEQSLYPSGKRLLGMYILYQGMQA